METIALSNTVVTQSTTGNYAFSQLEVVENNCIYVYICSEPAGHLCWTFPTAAVYLKATNWLATEIYRKVEKGREESLKTSLPGAE